MDKDKLSKRFSQQSNDCTIAATTLREKLRVASATAYPNKLLDIVHDIADEEAAGLVFTQASNVILCVADEVEFTRWVFEGIAWGADDGWSGRGNDDKRRVFDAKRQTFQAIMNSLRFS